MGLETNFEHETGQFDIVFSFFFVGGEGVGEERTYGLVAIPQRIGQRSAVWLVRILTATGTRRLSLRQ